MQKVVYISFGAGVQSTALVIISALGLYDCPKADFAVFADTQSEPQWVYDNLERMTVWAKQRDLPIYVTTVGSLEEDMKAGTSQGRRCASIPGFTRSETDGRTAMVRRQCTGDYKITPISKYTRKYLGFVKWARIKGKVDVTALIGISRDEAHRMKDAREIWIRNKYPLVEAGLFRFNCVKIIQDQGLPVPKKSACRFCPYHSDEYWNDLKINYPDEFNKAVEFDATVRDMSKRGLHQPLYLHRSLKPLSELTFNVEADIN